MKRLGIAIIFFATLLSLDCGGGGSAPDVLSGNWTATLSNPDGTPAFTISTTLQQSGNTVDVTKFDFTFPSTCFAAGTTAAANFGQVSTTHGVTSGTLQMTFQSGPANVNGANSLAFQGASGRTGISGTWTLTGTGTACAQAETSTSGNFVMLPS